MNTKYYSFFYLIVFELLKKYYIDNNHQATLSLCSISNCSILCFRFCGQCVTLA